MSTHLSRRWLPAIAAVALLVAVGAVSPVDAADDDGTPKNEPDPGEVPNTGYEPEASDEPEEPESEDDAGPQETMDIPPGQWTGAVFFDGSRTSAGLSAVGQPTEIFEQVDNATIDLDVTIGDGEQWPEIESGTAAVSMAYHVDGNFAASTESETGMLQVGGDITRFEASGVLARTASVFDSDGTPIPSVSGTTNNDVVWVFELANAECGVFEYRLSADSKGYSLLWFASGPAQETDAAGFDITNNLNVTAYLKAPGGPDFVDLAMALQQVAEVAAAVEKSPNEQNVELLLLELEGLEALRSRFIEAGECVDAGQAMFFDNGQSKLQQLITDMIGVLLEQDGIPLEVLVKAVGIGVRTGAIAPGVAGPGQDLLDLAEEAVAEDLADAIVDGDVETITDIYVWATQYGLQDLAALAWDVLEKGAGG